MKVVYVAGPYRDPRGEWYVLQNIREAEAVALELWRAGYAVVCPHKNTALLGGACGGSEEVWLKGDLEIMRRCDFVVCTARWQESEGAKAEVKQALLWDMAVYVWRDGRIGLLADLAEEAAS